jgi:hypothetical protein
LFHIGIFFIPQQSALLELISLSSAMHKNERRCMDGSVKAII